MVSPPLAQARLPVRFPLVGICQVISRSNMRFLVRNWRGLTLAGLGVLLVASGAIWYVFTLNGGKTKPVKPQGEETDPATSQLPRVTLEEITASSGITFRHQNGARGDKLLPETMGGGGAFLDFDGDGFQDLFLVQSGTWPDLANSTPGSCALYRNQGDGTFAAVPEAAGAALTGFFGMGVAVGDFDNDGWPDLAVSGLGGVRLLHNEPGPAGRRFVDITSESGLPYQPLPNVSYAEFKKIKTSIPFGTSITWVDYDLDGKLDLAWGEYLTWSPGEDLAADARLAGTTIRAYAPPTAFPGARVQLWRNRGSSRFVDVGTDSGMGVREKREDKPNGVLVGKSLGILATDLDGDGWPEILVSNDMARNFLFHNQPAPGGGRRFVERGLDAGFAYAEGPPRAGMGIDEAHYAPGRRAVVVVNFAGEPDSFFDLRSGGSGIGFSERARSVGIAIPSREWLKFGALFLDLDRDGHLDLLTTCGHLEPDIAQNRKGQTHAQPPQIFWNARDPQGKFVPWGASQLGESFFKPMVGRGCAIADLKNDGRTGIALFGNAIAPRLFHANPNENGWIRLIIKGDGQTTNRDAQGALVKVESEGLTQILRVGGARSYLSQSELPLTIGLGPGKRIDKVTVRFPGASQSVGEWTGLESGMTWKLEQGNSKPVPVFKN